VLQGTVKVTVVRVGPHTVQTVTLVVQPSGTDVVVGAAGFIVVVQVVVTAVKPVGQISVYTASLVCKPRELVQTLQ